MAVKKPEPMRLFLITGHGRSGTNYMAYLFSNFGFKVGAQTEQEERQ